MKVFLDGEAIVFDTKAMIVDGRTMVPLRAVFEALSMTVSWDDALEKVTAEKEGLEIILFIGSKIPTVNGKVVEIDVASYVLQGRTMVPLRFIAESTGALVEWDGSTNSVYITSQTDLSEGGLNLTYPIVDTGVTKLYSDNALVNSISEIAPFYGQETEYLGN